MSRGTPLPVILYASRLLNQRNHGDISLPLATERRALLWFSAITGIPFRTLCAQALEDVITRANIRNHMYIHPAACDPVLPQHGAQNLIPICLHPRHHCFTHTVFLVNITPIIEQDLQNILPSLLNKMQSSPFYKSSGSSSVHYTHLVHVCRIYQQQFNSDLLSRYGRQ